MMELEIFASEIARRIKVAEAKKSITVAIDGRCASGKTTLAKLLSDLLSAPVVHADHFFLRPEQRSKHRLSEVGGNLDRERLITEVLAPQSEGKSISYSPYDCSRAALGNKIDLPNSRILIVEGSYSLHPELRSYYDFKIFVTTDEKTQRARIISREGARASAFFERWIPLEEEYFASFDPQIICDAFLET